MKKNKISKNWINRQKRDIYVRKAKVEGFRSMAVYKIEEIRNSRRNPYLKEIEHLPDDERWMIVSEGRPSEMIWFICYPKTKR